MQKVRFLFQTAYKITIYIFFPHGTTSIAHVLYLVFEEGSPEYSNCLSTILLS